MNANQSGAQSDLRLQPQMIPRLQQAYQEALTQLAPAVSDAKAGYRIERPAMGDMASQEFQATFNQYADDGPSSIIGQVITFEQRLRETVDKLAAIQQAYDRNETDTAITLSRQLEP